MRCMRYSSQKKRKYFNKRLNCSIVNVLFFKRSGKEVHAAGPAQEPWDITRSYACDTSNTNVGTSKNSGSAHVRELRGGLSTGVRQRGPAAGAFPQKLCTIIRFKQKLFSKVCGLQHRPNCSYVQDVNSRACCHNSRIASTGVGSGGRGYAGDLTPQLFMWGILICISPQKNLIPIHANCMQHVLRCWERQSDGPEYKKTLRRPGRRPGPR